MAASNVFKVKMEKTDQLFNNYTTSVLWIQDGRSANEARTAKLAIIVSYPTSASGISVLLKTPPKYREFVPTLYVKTNEFQLGFNFWAGAYSYHFWRAWDNGSYTMMAKVIRTLELHYPMIQFLIVSVSSCSCTVKSI